MADAPRPRRSGDPREPVTAALVRESESGPRNTLKRRSLSEPWQEKVKDYDRNGPGVAGYYLDTVSWMGALCPLFVSVRNKSGEWERSDDAVLQVALDAYKGPLVSQAELVYAALRGREAVGRIWHVRDVEAGYHVISSVVSADDFRVVWRDLYGRTRISDARDVYRSWFPDPHDPHLATSPMRRALPDLRRLRALTRNQTRAAESRMLTNGILSFPYDLSTNPPGGRPFEGIDTPERGGGGRQGVPERIRDFIELSQLAHTDDESPAAMVPYPVEGPPPVWTDLGRVLDPMTTEAERLTIESFARAVNWPQQLLVAGPGAANHWNEFLLQETAIKTVLAPKLLPICNDILIFHLRPMIERFRNSLPGWRQAIDPRHVRVEFDLSFLLRRPTQFAEVMEAYRMGVATREDVAEALGLKGALMQIPNGMSEYEHWELATAGKGAPYAEVDRDGNLIVPDPNAGMLPPPVADVPMLPPADGAAPPAVDAGPDVAQALGGGSAPLGGGPSAPPTGPTSSDVQMPNPPVVAALEDETSRAWDDAAQLDARTAAALSGIVAVMVAETQREIARRTIREHEPRSELRQRLAALPVEQVWSNADPAAKARVPVEEIVAEVADRYRPQIQAVYEDAAAGFLSRHGDVIAALAVTAAIGAAVTALTSGFSRWASVRYLPELRVRRRSGDRKRTGAGIPARDAETEGTGMVTHYGQPVVPPTMIVRDSLAVAGGAEPDRDGLPMRDPAGNPTPVAGGPWRGGSGWLTGHNVVSASPRPPIRWRWHHGFIRTPREPYTPHLDLDGDVFDSPSDVPGGFFPNDHPHCSCALLPEA